MKKQLGHSCGRGGVERVIAVVTRVTRVSPRHHTSLCDRQPNNEGEKAQFSSLHTTLVSKIDRYR